MASAGLVHVSDSEPGISRHRRGRGFTYVAPDGTTIARGAERARLEALAVPPAYQDVWLCARPNGHLQATGRDQRQRKQYRYHPDWTAAQAKTKFDGLIPFAQMLPRIRRRVREDLREDAGEEVFALASAVTLIDRASLRVGDAEYTRQNGSYGALTLRGRHIRLDGDHISLRYTAKGGKKVRRRMSDRMLARILHRISDLPGAELLSWVDDDGTPQALTSSTLNAYLAEIAGQDGVTAKTFRTWNGTRAAFEVAASGGATIKDMTEAAAKVLNNTPTVARNSYVHPAVIDLAGADPLSLEGKTSAGLLVGEARLLQFLESV
jgi:DNA topoisomerase-1